MIRLLADQNFPPLADAMAGDPGQRLWLLSYTGRRLGLDPLDPLSPQGIGVLSVLPQFFCEDQTPDALGATRAWTGALLADQDAHIASGQLAALKVPVSLISGARDQYLSTDLA